jgi:LmbE family N-acetylglucosaminyl deacetylase
MVYSRLDIKKLGTILGIWAHPDDETFVAGGIMATAVRNGQPVVCIMATRGEAGIQDPDKWSSEVLGDIRSKELASALGILGVPKYYQFDYMDGDCDKVSAKEAVLRLKVIMERYKPNTILTFGPDGMTGHPDHATVSAWTTSAVEMLDPKPTIYHAVHTQKQYDDYLKEADEKLNIFFNISKPAVKKTEKCDLCYELPSDIQKLKYQALKAMPSQTIKMLEAFDEKFICAMLGSEAFVKSK